jgi:hypothetical protein
MAQRRSGGNSRSSGSRSAGSGKPRSRSASSKRTPSKKTRSQGTRSKSSSAKATEGKKSKSRATRGTAPSAPDIEKLEKFEPSEEAKRHEPSDVDAMGQDKRRQVVGHSYGPSKSSQVMFFVAVATILVVVVGGWLALVSAFDNPPEQFSERAPWSTTASDPRLAAEQNAKPVSPLTPCGEPGNEYPVPAQSPCAPPNKANDFQGSSTGQ